MDRLFIVVGSFAACLGIALGAFGRHQLGATLSESMLSAYETALDYHLTHALAVVVVGCILRVYSGNGLVKAAGWMLLAGIVLFCGSLYLMAITSQPEVAVLTPLGGLAFLLGWLVLALGMSKN